MGRVGSLALGAAMILAGGCGAQAAELRILISGAFKSPMAEIAPLFEKATGHKIVQDADISGRIAVRIGKDEQTDFIISTSAGHSKGIVAGRQTDQ